MEKLDKRIKFLLIFGIVSAIIFVVAIPLIPLTAGKNWVIMGISIGLVVFGFYAMPFIWVAYGTNKTNRTILNAVLNENLYTISELSDQLGMRQGDMLNRVRSMLNKGYLKGFLLKDNNFLVLNQNIKQEKAKVFKCTNCGATTNIENKQICDYCGGAINNK